jgi:hypothetical protein
LYFSSFSLRGDTFPHRYFFASLNIPAALLGGVSTYFFRSALVKIAGILVDHHLPIFCQDSDDASRFGRIAATFEHARY